MDQEHLRTLRELHSAMESTGQHRKADALGWAIQRLGMQVMPSASVDESEVNRFIDEDSELNRVEQTEL